MSLSPRWILCVATAVAALGTASAQDGIEIQAGLVPYQVIQCDEAGQGVIELSGTASGTVQARIVRRDQAVRDWTACEAPEPGKWSARFEGVPAGGPYTVEVRVLGEGDAVAASASVENVLVGDLWVLAGQSNMQGVGNNINPEEPSDQVNLFAMNDEWRVAQDPLHRLGESVDVVHNGGTQKTDLPAEWTKGAGLGLTFAKEMVRLTGRPVGLVACAHGGTSMAQWDPALRDKGGESLYGSMYRRFQVVGGKVRGVVWYQGESDANPDAGPLFLDKFKQFVEAVRSDFGDAELPFYYVQIGRFTNPGDPTWWNAVQQDQLTAESQIPHSGLAPSVDLELDDGIHIGTEGLKVLGRRLASIAARDLYQAADVANGPRPASIKRVNTPFGPQIHVTFEGVNGGLTAAGRVAGFSISAPDGSPLTTVYDQTVSDEDPNTIVLWCAEVPSGAQLWYGRGFDPYCNVVDKAGMAVPVFGPRPIPD